MMCSSFDCIVKFFRIRKVKDQVEDIFGFCNLSLYSNSILFVLLEILLGSENKKLQFGGVTRQDDVDI
ncbi:hypothetical protein CKAN_00422700 [Cinnamomum micranthum f. kanehirae]|uniref:Uncharacterized protein n=1 Tax=Cinnamomum micranthum f. kanehirae TaxID=337451 RepID=A0A443NBF0_9MAGN|nr:hypothetical protein CKAN_00422700 [Cinnamomum micranthum f. kanehirae]